jgi:hypothetical protein
MYSFDITTKTNQTVVCSTGIPSDSFRVNSKFICIPTSLVSSIDNITLIETIKDAVRYADAMDLVDHRFDDGYFEHTNKLDIPYLMKTIERAEKLRETDIPTQLQIDIEAIIHDCKEQLLSIKRDEEREQMKIAKEDLKKLREQEIGYIYLIKSDLGYKIGKSSKLPQRVRQIGIQVPFEHEFIFSAKFKAYHLVEKILHNQFSSKRIKGEWFDLTEEDVLCIREYSEGKVE